ncbi:glycosyltransferase family 2 protein [Flavobacterium dauae]|uniref:glycosyltransferase family 2 protein n=1 Tax=Flavobacterium dauae TaxID=1563479 RepID=UPI00101B28D2|nr:glycosyltransferase family 2 protein [Flavobacterium dauae]WLD24699.1 glycosyltransferase family 2 protein [Flavobacterium dauae]
MNIFISVVIPTYKPQSYILECIDSLQKQTLTKKLFEVIIILNGDKEPYYTEVENYIKEHDNFKIIHTATAGVSNARNIGIDAAKGSHVVFIDDDDFITEIFLEEMYNHIVKTPLNLVVSNFLRYYADNQIENDYMTNSYEELNNSTATFSLVKNRKILSSSCGKAIPKEVISDCRFKETVKISEDALFMFEISKNIKGISFLPLKVAYYRRIRIASASRKKTSVSTRFKILVQNINNFSKVYFRNSAQYSFSLYINRIMAITKHFLISLKNS